MVETTPFDKKADNLLGKYGSRNVAKLLLWGAGLDSSSGYSKLCHDVSTFLEKEFGLSEVNIYRFLEDEEKFRLERSSEDLRARRPDMHEGSVLDSHTFRKVTRTKASYLLPFKGPGYDSSFLVPLMNGGPPVDGVVAINGDITPEKGELLEFAVRHIAFNIMKRCEERYIDGQTGLLNNIYHHEHYQKIVKECMEKGQPLGYIILDVNDFKDFNNTYGHDVGDGVIKEVAKIVTKSVRKGNYHRKDREEDLVIRKGKKNSDEMVILVKDKEETLGQTIENVVGRIWEGVDAFNSNPVVRSSETHRTTKVDQVMLSVAVGCANSVEDGYYSLSELADKRQYEDKAFYKRMKKSMEGKPRSLIASHL